MAITVTATAQTDWTIEEYSEDLEFQFKDDGQSRLYRFVGRVVISREIDKMTSADSDGNLIQGLDNAPDKFSIGPDEWPDSGRCRLCANMLVQRG